ncbi:MAG TPA: PA domain-containing protein [Methylomirabilota bacterium]|nr:PA domain-containing protein [Methylomirabilota bacterium]
MRRASLRALLLPAILLLAAPALHAADVVIVNMDSAGEGFNDPSAPDPAMACPAGMNLGQCRLACAQAAAQAWADQLDSAVEVRVYAKFDPMSCGVLGSSLQLSPSANFPGAHLSNTWYQRPLADALSGTDRNPGQPDLQLTYNSDYDNGVCTGGPWYYGTDANPGLTGALLFYPVILHEMAHGLGFASFVNKSTGAWYGGLPDIFATFILDATAGQRWTAMTDTQRYNSIRNNLGVVTDGANTKVGADNFLTGFDVNLVVNSGAAAGIYLGRGALFGAGWGNTDGVTGTMQVVNDGAGASTTDGCEPLVGFTPGRVAFIDRGNCQFGVKALNAEQAGASGVVVADNVVGALTNMAPGTVGRQVTIPTIFITKADGDAIRTTLPQSVTYEVLTVWGMHTNGFPLLYTPTTMEPGSSVSHFDVSAGPNALMEPVVNDDLWDDLDMTVGVFKDEGWTVIVGGLFADDFETGNTGAWSVTVP